MSKNNEVVVYYDPKLTYSKNIFEGNHQILTGLNFILENLGMDCKGGNPLGEFVSPGESVVIKPNFVTIKEAHFNLNSERQSCVTTNRALIAPMIKYAFNAVGSKGHVTIVDSPIEASDFDETMQKLGITEIVSYFKSKRYPLTLLDLRDSRVVPKTLINDQRFNGGSLNVGLFIKKRLSGDPTGYTTVDLGTKSYFHNYSKIHKLRFYKPHFKDPVKAHTNSKHRYSIANTVLRAKLIINLPKMKTHKIAGVTLSLKNNIGLISKKTWLPHYTEGYPPYGDQYDTKPSLNNRIQNFLRVIPLWNGNSIFIRFPRVDNKNQQVKMPIYNGSWIGNDTLWRTVLDVAKVVEYADTDGKIQDTPQRAILNILDGIIAGEGNGPLGATPRHCGLLMGSFNMYVLDVIAMQIMGLDIEKIKYLKNVDREKVEVITNVDRWPIFHFRPPDRWEKLQIK